MGGTVIKDENSSIKCYNLLLWVKEKAFGSELGTPPQEVSLFVRLSRSFDSWYERLASKQQQQISDNYRYNSTKLLGKNDEIQFIGH